MLSRCTAMRIAIVSAMVLTQGGDLWARPAAPVPLAQLRQRGVMGALGVKLGTIVTVEGRAIPNKRRTKADQGVPLFLRVERVNGKRLKSPLGFRFTSTEIKPPRIGTRFRYVAYETGAYVGIPDGLFKHVPAFTGVGYFFETSLRIVKLAK